jgi:hypothetical protein
MFGGERVRIESDEGIHRLQPTTRSFSLDLGSIEAQRGKVWTVSDGSAINPPAIRSLPAAGVWHKGITRYHASFPGRGKRMRLRFFTDDFHSVWVNGRYAAEASNRALEVWIGSGDFPIPGTADLEIYVADTGRPKEDLGRWRMDEKKGLVSAEWLEGSSATALDTKWQMSFGGLGDLVKSTPGHGRRSAAEYSFSQPDSRDK